MVRFLVFFFIFIPTVQAQDCKLKSQIDVDKTNYDVGNQVHLSVEIVNPCQSTKNVIFKLWVVDPNKKIIPIITSEFLISIPANDTVPYKTKWLVPSSAVDGIHLVGSRLIHQETGEVFSYAFSRFVVGSGPLVVPFVTVEGFDFYKVKVSGVMLDVNVIAACKAMGLNVPCYGLASYDDGKCIDVGSTGNFQARLSQVLCNTRSPTACPGTVDTYQYMGEAWMSGSSCGVHTTWCYEGSKISNKYAICTD